MSEKERTEKLRENANQDHRKTATDTHSTSWWRWVTWLAGLVLISWSLSGSQVLAQECYECGSSKSDDGHYAYAEKDRVVSFDNVPNPNANCNDSRNKCDHGCGLWRDVSYCCNGTDPCPQPKPPKCSDKQCYKQYGYALVKEQDCHFLLVPTDPVIGVEDTNNRNKHNYWNDAWYCAQQGKWKIKHHTRTSLGLAINPATKRSQHQLHIHIGRLKKPLREMLQAKNVKHDGSWYALKIDRKDCHAKFFQGQFPWPFTEVSKEFDMYHSGIIVAGSYYKETEGFYIVRYYDVYVEGLLNYECPPK